MLVGASEQFAMEYEIVPSPGRAILGHFRMWANGREIGDFQDVLVLTAVQAQIEHSLRFADRLADPALLAADKADAVRIIQETLYGASVPLSLKYARFNLTDVGLTSFDRLWVFLIATPTEQRLLWRKKKGLDVGEVGFPVGTYETVAREFLRVFGTEISNHSHLRH